jgi:hypothetical protein
MFPSKSLLHGAVLAAAAALPAAALTPLPPARWTPEQRHEVLALTRTLRLAPDLSALGPGEQAALKELLAAGELVQQVYEVQVHPQARQALAQIRALPPGQERDEFLQLYRLFKGPIGTTPANARATCWPTITKPATPPGSPRASSTSMRRSAPTRPTTTNCWAYARSGRCRSSCVGRPSRMRWPARSAACRRSTTRCR